MEQKSKSEFRCGYTALLGRPNVGKSTLLNQILGTRIAAVSPKAQTTRRRLRGVFSDDRMQAIFVDTPGIHLVPQGRSLNEYCVAEAGDSIADADVLAYMIDTSREYLPTKRDSDEFLVRKMIFKAMSRRHRPLIILLNKIDSSGAEGNKTFLSQEELMASIQELEPTMVLPISARTGMGVPEFLKALEEFLPVGPALYAPDDLTDAKMRDVAGELVQEQLFLLLGAELPYSCAVEVVKFKEPGDGKKKIEIDINIHVERESQKPMLIGKGGAKIKEIGIQARKRIEEVVGEEVILKLFVKVTPNWSENERRMRDLGYALPARQK